MVSAYALALVVVIMVLWALRRIRWPLPPDVVGFLGRLTGTGSPVPTASVNVEYRDASGTIIDLGPFVRGTLRNGRGGRFELHEGAFVDCDPDRIKAGTVSIISLQDGLVKETVFVQLDYDRQTLFARSQFSRSELLEQINHLCRQQ
jgi:hypothetical protein